MEPFHLLSLSRLEYPMAVFSAPYYSYSSSMISLTLWKILLIYLLMTPPSVVTALIFQTGRLQPLPSLQTLTKSQEYGQTLGLCLSILSSLTLYLFPRKDHLANPPIYFLNNSLEEIQSFKILGFTIRRDLSWRKPHFKVGLQSQPGHALSYKILPWHT